MDYIMIMRVIELWIEQYFSNLLYFFAYFDEDK